ncbi:MAG: hypothetical protein WC483_00135 [Candidatus Paceibacterota bacterium]
MATYIGKNYWPAHTDLPCLNCKGPIRYRPLPIGVREEGATDGIVTCSGFCSPPCMRRYATQFLSSDEVERLTTRILLDFKSDFSDGDDPDVHQYLQQFERFSQIPVAPPPHDFAPYGTLTHDKYRESWTASLRSTKKDPTESFHAPAPSLEEAEDFTPRGSDFRRVTGFSTRRQHRVGMSSAYTGRPFLDMWMDEPH